MMRVLAALFALSVACSTAIAADDPGASKIDDMVWQTAGSRCYAWREAQLISDPAAAPLVFISFPGSGKPFAMRAMIKIDGTLHELRQIAYAREGRTLSIHYRTHGYRNYDVRLDLANLIPGRLEGGDLSGTITVSRFGLFSSVAVSGFCSEGEID
jgi:hypothetical protein